MNHPFYFAATLVPATLMLLAGCAAPRQSAMPEATLPASSAVQYPETRRVDHTDTYHGTVVADPYRWLENLDGTETAAWVAAQNALARPYLENVAGREAIESRLRELWNYERFDVPFKEGSNYFYSRNDGLQNQSVLYVTPDLNAPARAIIDPNTFSEDATISLGGLSVGPEGHRLAYGVSDGGTDWRIWRVRNVDTGQDLPDELRGMKFASVDWAKDGSGLYYSRYPQTPDGTWDDSKQVRVYFHELGTAQNDDRLIYEVTDHPRRNPYANVTDDGRFLILNLFDGYQANGIYYKDLAQENAPIVRLLDKWDGLYNFLGNNGTRFFFSTTKDAPLGKVVSLDIGEPEAISTVIPEGRERLEGVSYVGGKLVAQYLKDAQSVVRVYDENGAGGSEVALPGIGTISGFYGDSDATETFFSFSSFTTPGAIYRYDLASGDVTLWKAATPAGIDPGDFDAKQIFYTSKDGTRVPMFIISKKGLQLNGANPTLLYGYGGFDVSLTPGYSPARMAWLEMGGVLAIPNLRGGGEYGKAWHDAGTKLQKQNVFDDFIAAAEWLIANNYTRPSKLAIQGGSNGGLLIGATMTQRPDLFGAALPAVGVLDMLRYHTASANAWQWSSDYGLSDNADEFQALYAYSPVHNVDPGTCYPPTLITTADHDDRVVPWHSFKFAAALQAAQACDNPILIRVETRAGHGAGTPTWMRIEQAADQWAFLTKALGMEAPSYSEAK